MPPVYKVNKLTKDNHITDIYVFSGLQKERAKELTDTIRSRNTDELAYKKALSEFFDDEEIAYITNNDTNVEIVPMAIYSDDSIDIVKRKILLATDTSFPFESMYLFAKVKKRLSPVTTYQTLTQNGRIELTRFRMIQFLSNIGYAHNTTDTIPIQVKDTYDYDDIIALGLEKQEWDVSVPIGQHFVAVEGTYPYSVNPYNVDAFDPLLVNSVSNMVSTTNSQLLMDSSVGGHLEGNDLFLCLVSDVMEFILSQSQQLSEETAFRIYYPFLSSTNIVTVDEYNDRLTGLIKNSKQIVSSSFVKQIGAVELLNQVYEERDASSYSFIYEGVDSIEFILHPQYSFNLPLDIIFKVLHADATVPMLKLNPGKGQEKIYRLYADKTSTDGRLIPYMSKSEALKYAKVLAKKSRVSAMIQPPSSSNIFFCEFADDGDVTIKATCAQILPISVVEELIREFVNPVISSVSDFLAQSGYQFDLFKSLSDERVEMLDVSYKLGFPIRKQIGVSKKHSCLSPVFNIVEEKASSKTTPIKLQYKRVSDFSEMESQEAFMLNQMKRGTEEEELIAGTMANFGMTEQQVRERLAALLSGLQVVHNAFQNKRFRIKNNPGFPVIITRNVATNAYDVVVSEITGAQYISHVRTFVDSMMRITQDMDTTAVSKTRIESVCRGTKKSKDDDLTSVIADIVAAPEKPVSDYVGMDIVDEQIDFRDDAEQDDYLDMLLGVDDDEEDGEEGNGAEYEDEEEQSGGSKPKSRNRSRSRSRTAGNSDDSEDEPVRDIAGMTLGHPNPFFRRMQQRDPALFVTKKEGKFKAYSKICQWNQRRQPVVLTQEEKERIDKKHPGSYKHAVKYGSDPKNPMWYICPRYWSLSRNTALTEEQVKSGKYGKVISNPDAKVVPEGEDIFEFGHYDSEGNYQDYYPGFIDPGSHPDGFCLPCCFKTWGGPKQTQLREQCERQGAKISDEAEGEVKNGDKPTKTTKKTDKAKTTKDIVGRVEADDYIMGSDKFPLDQGRWGFLVPVLQMFFQYDSKKCIVSPSKPTLKLDTPCLLRRGVESSRNQSFIAAIADAYAEENKNNVLSVSAMRRQIASAVTLSNYRLFQNGNLVDLFYDSAKQNRESLGNDITKYDKEPIVVELNGQKNGSKLLTKLINSYENFMDYLSDDNVVMDYTYLWDIVCTPNNNLFKKGMNLVILEAPNDDITGNVQLICPTNQYVRDPFDYNRGSLILFKSGNYYEPLYEMKNTGKSVSLTRFFSLKSHNLLAPIKAVLDTARSATNEMCVPLASMPAIYNFRSNITAMEAYRALTLRDAVIKQQIINYSGQTIAFIATLKGLTGYVPTQASSPIQNIPQTLIDDYSGYSNYERTVAFLDAVMKATKGKIPCRPKLRMEEDGLTVGIITETNQLIMLAKPELITSRDALPAVDENMSVARDAVSEIGDGVDMERVEYVTKIRLETEFYNSFRNTIRILLSRYDNRKLRADIESKVRSPFLTYTQKLREVGALLRTLTEDYIMWDDKFDVTKFMNEYENDESYDGKTNKPSSCILFKKDKCEMMPLCSVSVTSSSTTSCRTILPTKNILTGADSKNRYYAKMADELVRYSRIRSFVFKPQTFLSFGKVGYDLRDNEILILQAMMTPEYFDGLEVSSQDAHTYNNTFQTAQPAESVPYSSVYVPQKSDKVEGKEEQVDKKKSEETGDMTERDEVDMEVVKLYGKWKAFFPPGTSEVKFANLNPRQTFQPIILLIQRLKPSWGNVTITELKELLSSLYDEMLPNVLQVKSIWANEGKKQFARMLTNDEATVDSIVMSESYFASTVDFILIANKVGLPIVFYTSTKISANDKSLLKTATSTEYSFIKVPSLDMPELPSYRIIVGKEGLQIPLLSLNASSREEIEELPVFTLADYLRPIVIKVKKQTVVRKKVPPVLANVKNYADTVVEVADKPKRDVPKRKPRLKIVA